MLLIKSAAWAMLIGSTLARLHARQWPFPYETDIPQPSLSVPPYPFGPPTGLAGFPYNPFAPPAATETETAATATETAASASSSAGIGTMPNIYHRGVEHACSAMRNPWVTWTYLEQPLKAATAFEMVFRVGKHWYSRITIMMERIALFGEVILEKDYL
ncbi:uncharacterized protein BDV14DRAFT_195454 [Aspergillus stella-maris]|uniref:uncharacterized protein n=1 Tax=Aspergillus stella-maris TaxID=1810926 RepID=UPI003CCE0416